jgi:hypothetical protein
MRRRRRDGGGGCDCVRYRGNAWAQVTYKEMADGLHAVMEIRSHGVHPHGRQPPAERREGDQGNEHFKDDKALPLPAQMFRFGAEMVAEKKMPFSYALLSLWPINKQNLPKTALEKKGLEAIAKDGTKPFYGEETLGKTKYFTAVYADKAIAPPA